MDVGVASTQKSLGCGSEHTRLAEAWAPPKRGFQLIWDQVKSTSQVKYSLVSGATGLRGNHPDLDCFIVLMIWRVWSWVFNDASSSFIFRDGGAFFRDTVSNILNNWRPNWQLFWSRYLLLSQFEEYLTHIVKKGFFSCTMNCNYLQMMRIRPTKQNYGCQTCWK